MTPLTGSSADVLRWSTAQNSRTFAWAGTAIAFLTLVATALAFITASH
jgi:hypothetical protein